jgi:two-component system phosphate regulon sensor histidine kinase PhoR
VIKGYASTLIDGIVGGLNEKQSEIVNHIYASAQSLASMVEEFLNVSKIEQGGMKYSFESVDVAGLVASLADEMKRTAEDKHLAFSIGGVTDGTCMIQADAVKLRQVFLNLIDNSIKYTQEGFVHVSLEKKIATKEVVITISDSGIGISEETKKKLFTKFGRGEEVRSHSGGSGLGLYLAQEVVKAHHGTIHVQSKGLHLGASFSVSLPYTV